MDLYNFLAKGVKAFIFNPQAPGEQKLKDAPFCLLQDGKTVALDAQSEWILLGYQFNASALLPPMGQPVLSSFFLEDGVGGNPITPTHFWSQPTYSPLIECLFRFGLGKPIYLNLVGGALSIVLYVWDPNYQNTRRTNF